ncbi:MAG: hypothetical protein ACLVKO_11270 [Dysgonomonas sp.]
MDIENIIWLLIVGGAVVVSFVQNYNKEKKKDNKRVVGKPNANQTIPKPQTVTSSSESANKPVARPFEKKNTPKQTITVSNNKDIKPKDKDISEASAHLDTLEYDLYNNSNTNNSKFSEGILDAKEFDYTSLLEDDVAENQNNNINSVFKTKDELKKAVLYSVILERKY